MQPQHKTFLIKELLTTMIGSAILENLATNSPMLANSSPSSPP